MGEIAISVGCKYCVNDADEHKDRTHLMRTPFGINVMMHFYQQTRATFSRCVCVKTRLIFNL